MEITRRNFFSKLAQFGCIALMAGLMVSFATAQTLAKLSDRPITILVPYTPGGSTDALARLIGQKMSERMGQPVVIDNRPGASGVIASQQLLRMPADGRTLLFVVNTHTINSSVIDKLPYDPAKDFVPVGTVASSPFLLAVNASVKAGNFEQFIALARKTAGGLAYGTVGSAGMGRLVGETFGEATGTTIRYIPYKGSAPLLADLLGGAIDYVIDIPNVYLDHIASGKVRPIAISGAARHPALPNVPTFAEVGLKQYNPMMWYGLLARSGVPAGTIDVLSAHLREIVNTPEVQKALAAQTFGSFFTTPAEFGRLLTEETGRWARVVQRAHIKAE